MQRSSVFSAQSLAHLQYNVEEQPSGRPEHPVTNTPPFANIVIISSAVPDSFARPSNISMVSPFRFPAPERWSRGCGSGCLGPVGNGQIDGYRYYSSEWSSSKDFCSARSHNKATDSCCSSGILSGGQWVEALGAKDYEASGLSLRVPAVNSTQQVSYTAEVRHYGS